MTIVLVFVLVLSACACGAANSGGKERVVAGFYPLAYAAQELGGRAVSVKNLTPAGAEPHDLEVSPRDVADVKTAGLVLLLGRGFQPQLEHAAGHARNVLHLLDTPGLRVLPNGDPHVWLDPLRYALVVKRIGVALHRQRAAARFIVRLHALDAAYRGDLAHCARHELVTSHEAFAYLSQRYGLQQVGITGLNPEAEPTPRDLQHVIDVVRKTHATTVFFERLVSARIADTVARETGAHAAVLDPIEGLTQSEAARHASYFTLMRQNLATLRRALGCR
jgi:zinc transport system substrate-binding protein